VSSGSGPSTVAVATAILSTTAETVIATLPPSNWSSNPVGVLLTADVVATFAAAGTVTFRIRQGTLTGTLVTGTTAVYTAAAAITTVPAGPGEFLDASAFGQGPTQQGVYVLTAQASVANNVTPTGGVLSLETVAPVQ
jgi:hypothetical protein